MGRVHLAKTLIVVVAWLVIAPLKPAKAAPTGPDASDAAAALGYSVPDGARRSAFVVETVPSLGESIIRKGSAVFTVDLRFGEAGVLDERVTDGLLSLDAGTLLFRTSFRGSAELTDSVPAWCGPGRGGWFAAKTTVCLIDSPDGRARLAEGLTTLLGEGHSGPVPASLVNRAPPWFVSGVRADEQRPAIPRPRVSPVDHSRLPLLRLTMVYRGRVGRDHLRLSEYLEPANGGGGREYLRDDEVTLEGGAARLPFGRFVLRLSVVEEGLSARWEDAEATESTPPPPAQAAAARLAPTPYVIGGAHIDPASLVAASSPVKRGDILVEGPATHWRTAKAIVVARAMFIPLRTPKDAVFHKVEMVGVDGLGARSIAYAWCGPMSGLGLPERPQCLSTNKNGVISEDLMLASGRTWLAIPLSSAPAAQGVIQVQQADLVPSASDLAGPFSFAMRLEDFEHGLAVRAEAKRGDEVVTLWRGRAPFNSHGVARVPLWSHELVAQRANSGITVRLEPTGSGAGPLEQRPADEQRLDDRR